MNNMEEIPLDEDDHATLHGSALVAENAVSSIPATRNPVQAIPNSHDVHIVAAALGSYAAEEQPAPPTNQGGTEAQVKENSPQEQDDSSSEDSTSDEDESSVCDESEEEIHSYSDLRELIDNMTTHLDTHDNGPQPSAAELLFGNNIGMKSIDTVQVNPSDEIVEAGRIANCIEGTVIVTASPNSHLLGEGSILVTADRKIVGPVEDIFGPVQSPMYILRDPNSSKQKQEEENGGSIPAITVGDVLYSVPALSTRILEDDLRVKGYDADDIPEIEGEGDPECEFSDDEAVRCCCY
jgi:rRNA processing protein Gar1